MLSAKEAAAEAAMTSRCARVVAMRIGIAIGPRRRSAPPSSTGPSASVSAVMSATAAICSLAAHRRHGRDVRGGAGECRTGADPSSPRRPSRSPPGAPTSPRKSDVTLARSPGFNARAVGQDRARRGSDAGFIQATGPTRGGRGHGFRFRHPDLGGALGRSTARTPTVVDGIPSPVLGG